jgi:putative ATP-binding cassette transporter
VALFRYISRGPRPPMRKLVLFAAVAGMSNAGILAILNTAAEHASEGTDSNLWYLSLFAITLIAFTYTQRHLFLISTNAADAIVQAYRQRVAGLIRRCDLRGIDGLGRSRIYAAVTRQPQVVVQVAGQLVMAGQSFILVVFTLGYLATLSKWAVCLTFVVIGMAVLIYRRKQTDTMVAQAQAEKAENQLFEQLTDLIEGFKEVRLHAPRSHDLGTALDGVSDTVKFQRGIANYHFAQLIVVAQGTFYMLAGAIVFLLPAFGEDYSGELLKTVTVSLFLIGPISSIVGSAAAVAMVTAAANDMVELEDGLAELAGDEPSGLLRTDFREIHLVNATFDHFDAAGQSSFYLGPIDLTLTKGETLFISGGNGSGKSTLLRVLTALYAPTTGSLTVDGRPVVGGNTEAYQSLFSTVFADFHLFRRLYGLAAIDPERVDRTLEDVGLDHKVRFDDGSFDTLQLSTGQRKRLALVVAMLEDRPICVFDELAADQDPEFRRRFYEEFLPRLKAEGRTLVVVTHDDRYFGHGDRRVVMEEGRISNAVTDEDTDG